MILEDNSKVIGLLHGILGVNEYAVCDPARRYREQVIEELRNNSMTDVPELMAASVVSDALPYDLDPLNTVE